MQGKKEPLPRKEGAPAEERRSPCQGKKEPLPRKEGAPGQGKKEPLTRKEGAPDQGKKEPLAKEQRSFLSRNRGHFLINEVTEGKAQGPTLPFVN